MGKNTEDKAIRILSIYNKLLQDKVVDKVEESRLHNVDVRTIQRDISDIRRFLDKQLTEKGEEQALIYDTKAKGYRMVFPSGDYMSGKELLAVCKILLESRALVKEELEPILEKLMFSCKNEQDKKTVANLVANERHHYIELQHRKKLLNRLWEVEQAVKTHKYLEIGYTKLKNREYVERKVRPVGVMFSEFYFYMAAFIENIDKERAFQNPDDIFPTIYRIDRLEKITTLDEHFTIPEKERFEEGEFRKKVQFMYGGRLQTNLFWCCGYSLEAVLDRLPTAKIIKEEDERYLIKAETFGKGIDRWLRGQGDVVEVVK